MTRANDTPARILRDQHEHILRVADVVHAMMQLKDDASAAM